MMLTVIRRRSVGTFSHGCRLLSTTTTSYNVDKKSFRVVIVGGGAGGCSAAAKFSSALGPGKVAVIEPSDVHYYQPLWTLVGAGLKDLSQSARPMSSVLPASAEWIKDKVVGFNPDSNTVEVKNGDIIQYDFLVVAMGLQLNYGDIEGLQEALETPGVGSNYHPKYVGKTLEAIRNFKSGNAVFTFPNTPIKCAGAPQKIMYLTERLLQNDGRRAKADIHYYSPLQVIFGVKKYAETLLDIVEQRNINVHLRMNLVQVKPDTREAVFEHVDTNERVSVKYDLLHATPPMGPPDALKQCDKLVDAAGFLHVDKETLQHVNYSNIFGIGDCTSVPTAKTAAAVAGQLGILRKNLKSAMKGQPLSSRYDGYTSCPLVTGPGECVLAEFDFSVPPQPLETFPFNQAKPRWDLYNMKAHIMPNVYWQMLKGRWEGPRTLRKIMHLGMSR